MSKKLNITNFEEAVKALGGNRWKETEETYIIQFDAVDFGKVITKWSKKSGESVPVKKIIIAIAKDLIQIEEKTFNKLTIVTLDTFDDPIDSESYVVKTQEIKNRIQTLITELKK